MDKLKALHESVKNEYQEAQKELDLLASRFAEISEVIELDSDEIVESPSILAQLKRLMDHYHVILEENMKLGGHCNPKQKV